MVCVWVFNNNTYAQIRVINNKGTFFQVDTSKWVLSGIDIYNKNTIGNVGIGIFPNNARFVLSNGGSAILPAFKLKYPFSGALSDSILTWNPSDSTVRKITLSTLLNNNTIRSLNGLTNSIQTFETGTTGTDFNIVSSGTTHTFHFPDASSANRGLLTNTDWITFNNKIGTVTATTPAAVTTAGTTATINNTGAYWNANQLQGRNISTTAPTNGQFLTWNNTSSLWEPSNTTNDAKDHHITRSNTTANVSPTSSEIASPINGYTAKVHLTNGNVEYWSYNGAIWILDWTQIPPVDGIDIGYIVGWGSNVTPPDYLLPLNGGTYNWSDFPHLQSLQATHPSEFIASSTATTFTLVDINTSGRFLRGGLTAGVNQNFFTALPTTPFLTNTDSHSHTFGLGLSSATNQFAVSALFASFEPGLNSVSLNTSIERNTSSHSHSHSITSGGDSETRPINTSVIWCLKVKPTMTAGNITINTGGPVTTTVSNAIVGNELTTTVNGVSSTPVTLPTPEPAVVEIYDTLGTQALSTTFANLTFGTTNIADAGYTVGGSGSQITVTTAGTYRITYRVTVRLTNNSSSGGEFIMTRNGTEVLGTRGYTYNHNNNRIHGTVTVVKLLAVSAGDVIRVQGRRYSSSGNLSLTANGSSLIIERIK